MVLHPHVGAGVSGNFAVEDEKAGLQIGQLGANTFAVLFEQGLAFRFRADATLPQGCILQHVPNGHSGCLETPEKFDPGQD